LNRTLVDLPGWIHSESKTQSKKDVAIVQSLIREYIANTRTILLAVVSAKNDYANQVVLQECRNIDKDGTRTLGIITKPDTLTTPAAIRTWIDLAQNRDIYFKLGWQLLRNRADDERDRSFLERNLEETAFFDREGFKDLPKSMKGIDSLRTRLSKLLFNHLKSEIPKLKKELDSELDSVSSKLQALGEKRGTLLEQRLYLTKVFMDIHQLLDSGVRGIYENSYFGIAETDSSIIDSLNNAKRLRAVVQFLNLRFADNMRLRGHAFHLVENVDDKSPNSEAEQVAMDTGKGPNDNEGIDYHNKVEEKEWPEPDKITTQKALDWVKSILIRNRGRELPGLFNPMIVSQLFLDKSQRWESMAEQHIEAVSKVCKRFIHDVVSNLASPDIASRLISHSVESSLDAAETKAREELKQLLEDTKSHPISYNHYFTDNLQKKQQERFTNRMAIITEKCQVNLLRNGSLVPYIEPTKLAAKSSDIFEPDMTKYSAEQALDALDAYYKVNGSMPDLSVAC
jgi:hypothetical protein